eukprot:scaffold17206_cov65-Cylindrotheca_fusiformis.AAC.1
MSRQISQENEEEQPRPQHEAAVVAALSNADGADSSSSSNVDRSADLATWLESRRHQITLLNDFTYASLAKLLLQESEEELKDGTTVDGLSNYLKGLFAKRARIREGERTTKQSFFVDLAKFLMPRELWEADYGSQEKVPSEAPKNKNLVDLTQTAERAFEIEYEIHGGEKAFWKHLETQRQKFRNDENSYPFFCIVQSSGYGKSRLMDTLRREINDNPATMEGKPSKVVYLSFATDQAYPKPNVRIDKEDLKSCSRDGVKEAFNILLVDSRNGGDKGKYELVSRETKLRNMVTNTSAHIDGPIPSQNEP